MTESQSLVERLAGEAASSAHLPAAITAHPAFKAFRRGFAELVAGECAKAADNTGRSFCSDETVADVVAAIRQRFGVGE